MKKIFFLFLIFTCVIDGKAQSSKITQDNSIMLNDSLQLKAFLIEKSYDNNQYIMLLKDKKTSKIFKLIIPKDNNEKINDFFELIESGDLIKKVANVKMLRIAHFFEGNIDVKSVFY